MFRVTKDGGFLTEEDIEKTLTGKIKYPFFQLTRQEFMFIQIALVKAKLETENYRVKDHYDVIIEKFRKLDRG